MRVLMIMPMFRSLVSLLILAPVAVAVAVVMAVISDGVGEAREPAHVLFGTWAESPSQPEVGATVKVPRARAEPVSVL